MHNQRFGRSGFLAAGIDDHGLGSLETKGSAGDWLHNATVRNANMNTESLRARSRVVAPAVGARSLSIAVRACDRRTGRVTVVA